MRLVCASLDSMDANYTPMRNESLDTSSLGATNLRRSASASRSESVSVYSSGLDGYQAFAQMINGHSFAESQSDLSSSSEQFCITTECCGSTLGSQHCERSVHQTRDDDIPYFLSRTTDPSHIDASKKEDEFRTSENRLKGCYSMQHVTYTRKSIHSRYASKAGEKLDVGSEQMPDGFIRVAIPKRLTHKARTVPSSSYRMESSIQCPQMDNKVQHHVSVKATQSSNNPLLPKFSQFCAKYFQRSLSS